MGQDSRGLNNIKEEGERTGAIKKAWGIPMLSSICISILAKV